MIDASRLLTDTRKLVIALVDDLRAVATSDSQAAPHVADEHQRAKAAGRAAFRKSQWAEGLCAQVAVALASAACSSLCEDDEQLHHFYQRDPNGV